MIFILDDIIRFILEYILGKNIIYSTGLTFIRIGIFHIIGYFVGLSHTVSFTIATGVSFITLLLKFYLVRVENKKI